MEFLICKPITFSSEHADSNREAKQTEHSTIVTTTSTTTTSITIVTTTGTTTTSVSTTHMTKEQLKDIVTTTQEQLKDQNMLVFIILNLVEAVIGQASQTCPPDTAVGAGRALAKNWEVSGNNVRTIHNSF